MLKGIDVSYWQNASKSVAIPAGIDWQKVAAAGISFVIIKTSEGIGRVEPRGKDQAIGAFNAGLQIGYYHFAHAGEDTAVAEADLFYKCISQYPKAQIVPTLDIETNKAGLSAPALTQWIVDFVNRLKSHGIAKVMLYSYQPFFDQFLLPSQALADCPLWLADYRATPHVPHGWSKYDIWQYSNKGQIPGIVGDVDVNQTNQLPT
jgi:GH25 family lysozyme M1 (1,4-beta-N-acetylmuramidase)